MESTIASAGVAAQVGAQAGGARNIAAEAARAPAPQTALPEPKVAPEFKFDARSMMHDLNRTVRSINDMMEQGHSRLSFSIDQQLNRTLVRVTDSETGEVIRELPPEKVLNVARSIEQLKGVLFSDDF